MLRKTFHEPFWLSLGMLLPGIVAFGVWFYMAWQIDFEPVVSGLSGLAFGPFALLSLWLYWRHRRRRIRCNRQGIEYRRGKQHARLLWSEVTEFCYDLAGDGRKRLLLYEVRGPDERIRFHRSPGRSETDYDEFTDAVSSAEFFSRATWSFRSRGLLLSKRKLKKLRELIQKRTDIAPKHFTQLLQRPEPDKKNESDIQVPVQIPESSPVRIESAEQK